MRVRPLMVVAALLVVTGLLSALVLAAGPTQAQTTETARGDLVVYPNPVGVGQTAVALGYHVVPVNQEVVIEYSEHFTLDGEACEGSPGTTASGSSMLWSTLKACAAGEASVRLVEAGTRTVIDEVSVTVTGGLIGQQQAETVSLSGGTAGDVARGTSVTYTIKLRGLDSTKTYTLHRIASQGVSFASTCDYSNYPTGFRDEEAVTGVTQLDKSYTMYACAAPSGSLIAYLEVAGGRVAGHFPCCNTQVVDPTVRLGASSYTVNEGSSATIGVQLSYESFHRIPAPVSVTNGTAESADYSVSGLADGFVTVTFSGLDTSESFTISTNQDAGYDDETVNLGFPPRPSQIPPKPGDTNVYLPTWFLSGTGSPSSATLTIEDDEDGATPPGAPTGLTVTPGNMKLDVSWNAPASDGGSPITRYYVQHKVASAPWPLGPGADNGTSRTKTLRNLTNGTTYAVRVQACNTVGTTERCGDWSAEATGTPRTTPGRVAVPSVTPGDTILTVDWSAPDDGGASITRYNVERRVASELSWTFFGSTYFSTMTTVTGLTNGTAYQVRVQACNAAGCGDPSDPATGTPSLPSVSISQRNGEPLEYQEGDAMWFTLTASAAATADLRVTISVSENGKTLGDFDTVHTIEKGFRKRSFLVRTLSDDVDEIDSTVTVAVENGSGYTVGDPPLVAVKVKDNDKPAKPTAFQVHGHMTDGAVTLRWDRDNTVAIFDVQYIKEKCVAGGSCGPDTANDQWRTVQEITTSRTGVNEAREAEFSGKIGHELEAGGFYRIRIQSRNVDASGYSSDVVFHASIRPPAYFRHPITGEILEEWVVDPATGGRYKRKLTDKFGTMKALTYQRDGVFKYRVCDPSAAPTSTNEPSELPGTFTAQDVHNVIAEWLNGVVWRKSNGMNIIGTVVDTATDCSAKATTYNQVGFFSQDVMRDYCGYKDALGCFHDPDASLDYPSATPYAVFLTDAHDWTITSGGCADFTRGILHEVGHAFGLGHAGTNNSIMGATLEQFQTLCGPTLWDMAGMMRTYQSR